MAALSQTLHQLNSARNIVLKDHTLYPQVVPGIIPVISPTTAQLELRRWGADFLAETFASQVVTADEKQQMSLAVLDTLKGYLSRKEIVGEDEDNSVIKSAVQCAASMYPYVFRHTIGKPSDSETWGKVAAIKSSILRRMDTASPGVRICCIKFVACVVQIQTPGLIADPRRPESNEISLALVPRDHAVIPPANLEAEASGLLDRLLGVLQDNLNDPLIITATINALAVLVHRRATVSSKVLSATLNFNPLRSANAGMSAKDKIAIKSMTRTTISFLLNCLKRNPNGAFAGRIQQHIERLKHTLLAAFSESTPLKRPAPDGPIDGLDDAKRQRLNAEVKNGTSRLQQLPPSHPPLPSGPISLAQLWTLTTNENVASFHSERLPPQSIVQLIQALLPAIPDQKLTAAINTVRGRWMEVTRPERTAHGLNMRTEEAAGHQAPDYGAQPEQVANRLDQAPPEDLDNNITIGPFNLPPPPPLSNEERSEYTAASVNRVFTILSDLDKEAKVKGKQTQAQLGFNRLATTTVGGQDRDSWVLLTTRLATRSSYNLDSRNDGMKVESPEQNIVKKGQALTLNNALRSALLTYVMESFRARIDVAIIWLNEEWYSERLLQRQRQEEGEDVEEDDMPNYWRWTLRLLDMMMPYFDVKDGRVLIRLLSEVPAINRAIFERVKKIAEDPERIQISTNTLLYLIMFRPPVRQMAIDCAEEMYKENSDARLAAKKLLAKWRPSVVEQDANPAVGAEA
ncbi:Putative armadillo-like helical, symplekin/Pta1 [Septoria linicola]|uniref:Armadillo-like helical, symplekin/Pta1 n=1 Tax=Septoria linicola TaxID=215465 RepID=A0A9Q9EDI4_9PEZI|nr:putative armadillo-like helical, symplekin/Pta1 [Septoria linicola]USW47806.1 Putative armadillo-like helical, symplekin/Pta1 [Septoria linicola]